MSDEQGTKESYAMEFLFRDHYVVLIVICFGSLILGVPLSWNMLWHLQVSKNIHKESVSFDYSCLDGKEDWKVMVSVPGF